MFWEKKTESEFSVQLLWTGKKLTLNHHGGFFFQCSHQRWCPVSTVLHRHGNPTKSSPANVRTFPGTALWWERILCDWCTPTTDCPHCKKTPLAFLYLQTVSPPLFHPLSRHMQANLHKLQWNTKEKSDFVNSMFAFCPTKFPGLTIWLECEWRGEKPNSLAHEAP